MNDETDETNKVEVTNNSTPPVETQPETPPVMPIAEPSPAFSPEVEKEEFVVPPPAPKEPKKSSDSKKWLVWGVVVVLLVGMGALTYYFYSASQSDKQRADTATGSIDSANTTIANLRTQLSKALAAQDTTAPTKPTTDADQVKQSATQYICAGMKTSCANLKAETPKIADGYAKVSVADQVGQVVYLKRVTNGTTITWVAFFSSQNGIPKATVDKYSFPASLLSEGEVKDN